MLVIGLLFLIQEPEIEYRPLTLEKSVVFRGNDCMDMTVMAHNSKWNDKCAELGLPKNCELPESVGWSLFQNFKVISGSCR